MHSFQSLNNISLNVYTTSCVSIYSIDGHIGDFHLLANVNCASTNMHVQVSV